MNSCLEDLQELRINLLKATISSCTCFTMSPDIKYHDVDCRYRLIQRASNLSVKIENSLKEILEKNHVQPKREDWEL